MSFSSIPFLWFLAAFLTLYGFCPGPYRRYLLLLGSVVFVALGSFSAMLIALVAAGVNFGLGICVQRSTHRKLTLAAAVAINVLFLVTFKLSGAVPLGFSYYTFAMIAYLVDVSREQHEAEYDPFYFSTYAFFFPKFVMGPITRYGEMASELEKPKLSLNGLQTGLENFVTGFAMKIFIADRLASL